MNLQNPDLEGNFQSKTCTERSLRLSKIQNGIVFLQLLQHLGNFKDNKL